MQQEKQYARIKHIKWPMTQRTLDCIHLYSHCRFRRRVHQRSTFTRQVAMGHALEKEALNRHIEQEHTVYPENRSAGRSASKRQQPALWSMVYVSPSSPTPAKVVPVTPAAHEWRVRVVMRSPRRGPRARARDLLRCLTRARTQRVDAVRACPQT
jgi:hypothetical protein